MKCHWAVSKNISNCTTVQFQLSMTSWHAPLNEIKIAWEQDLTFSMIYGIQSSGWLIQHPFVPITACYNFIFCTRPICQNPNYLMSTMTWVSVKIGEVSICTCLGHVLTFLAPFVNLCHSEFFCHFLLYFFYFQFISFFFLFWILHQTSSSCLYYSRNVIYPWACYLGLNLGLSKGHRVKI